MHIHYHRELFRYRQCREPMIEREGLKNRRERMRECLHDRENLIQLIPYMQFEQHDVEIYKMESKLELVNSYSFVSFLQLNVVLKEYHNLIFSKLNSLLFFSFVGTCGNFFPILINAVINSLTGDNF